MMVQRAKVQIKKQIKKPKGKGKGIAKPNSSALKPKGGVAKEGTCFHFGQTIHWKSNCHKYMEIKKKGSETSASSISVIEVNLSTHASWVLDTGCESHICINVHGLKRSRPLAKGEVELQVENGVRVVLVVETCYLSLPTELVIELENYYFVHAISRNIIFISCLDKNGFSWGLGPHMSKIALITTLH